MRKKFPLSNFIWIGNTDKILSSNLSGLIDAVIKMPYLIQNLNQPPFRFFFRQLSIVLNLWKNRCANSGSFAVISRQATHSMTYCIATWIMRHTKLGIVLKWKLVKPARNKLYQLFELEICSPPQNWCKEVFITVPKSPC